MKIRILTLFIASFLCFSENLFADFLESETIGLGNLEKYLPFKNRKQRKNALLKFHTKVRGLGIVRVTLDYEKSNRTNAFYINEEGVEVKTDVLVTLIEGYAKIRGNDEIPVHATISKEKLKLEFNIASSKNLYNRHYKIFINKNKKTKVRRVTINKSLFEACGLPLNSLKIEKNSNNELATNYHPKTNTINTSSTKILNIGIDADKDWFEDFGSSSQSEILSIVSAADTIYREQLGISFNITRQSVFTNRTFGDRDSNNEVDAIEMLLDYQDYTSDQSYFSEADNFHLFSSANVKDGIIGLAYVGVVCSKKADSFAFTSRTEFDGTETITFAHELGHIFNAEHSTSGIMRAFLAFPLPETFSSTSLAEINDYLEDNNSCLETEEDDDSEEDDDDDEEDEDDSDDEDETTNPDPPQNDGNDGEGFNPEIDFDADIGPFSENKILVSFDETYSNCDFKIRASTVRRKVSYGEIIYLAENQSSLSSLEFNVNYTDRPYRRNRKNNRRNRFYLVSQIICEDGLKGEGPIVRIKPDYSVRSSGFIKPKRWLRQIGRRLERVR